MGRLLSRAGVLAALALFAFAGVAAAAPSNDSSASPVVLTGATGSVYGTNVDATYTGDEPAAAYWIDGATVWFEWTAPQNGTLSISADADWETTHVALFAGTPTASSEPVATDYTGVSADVVAGTRYYLSVDTEWSIGDFYVDWAFTGASAPANDMWSFPQSIEGAAGSVDGTTLGATAEAGEPGGAGHSVWFHWIAPQDGVVTFSVDGGQSVTAFSGTWLAELTPLPASAPVAAGDVLSVRVDGASPAAFTLSWQTAAAPAPAVSVPSTIVVDADSPQGRTVYFDASALDWKGRTIGVTCTKGSGYVFPVGTTTVTCTATDSGGRTSSAAFDVHVNGVPEQLSALDAEVVAAALDPKLTDKLRSKLADAQSQFAGGRIPAACSAVNAFLDTVQKNAGDAIAPAQADAFQTDAWRIRAVLNCA